MERPLCVLSPISAKSADTADIYINQEGIKALQKALTGLKKGEPVKIPVFEDGDWNYLVVHLSDQSGFDCDNGPCECGCQKPFAEIEALYTPISPEEAKKRVDVGLNKLEKLLKEKWGSIDYFSAFDCNPSIGVASGDCDLTIRFEIWSFDYHIIWSHESPTNPHKEVEEIVAEMAKSVPYLTKQS
jgi:hypothetical protein